MYCIGEERTALDALLFVGNTGLDNDGAGSTCVMCSDIREKTKEGSPRSSSDL
jgi:hypothetical protein